MDPHFAILHFCIFPQDFESDFQLAGESTTRKLGALRSCRIISSRWVIVLDNGTWVIRDAFSAFQLSVTWHFVCHVAKKSPRYPGIVSKIRSSVLFFCDSSKARCCVLWYETPAQALAQPNRHPASYFCTSKRN
jgi:hypothetical protein